jgi:hypothetical protein
VDLLKRILHLFVAPLVVCLIAIYALTLLAASCPKVPEIAIPEVFRPWIVENQGKRFDEWADGSILANYLYRVLAPDLSFWTYFKPDSAPNDPWRQLIYAVEPANFATLNNDINDRKGVFLYRYWTGHLVGTTILLSVFHNLETASMATRNIVLIALFAYTLSWARRFGTGSAIVLVILLVGTGAMSYESFHNATWGLAVAFFTGAYTANCISKGKSALPAAVAGGVLANWVGYDYVFDTIAFSLPFFMADKEGHLQVDNFHGVIYFAGTIVLISAIMMMLRTLVGVVESHQMEGVVGQIQDQTLYRIWGNFRPEEYPNGYIPGQQVSRTFAVLETLPIFNYYLSRLAGLLLPKAQSLITYIAFQTLPILGFLGLLLRRRPHIGSTKVITTLMSLILISALFHTMFIVFYNHASVHPYMDVRHMVFNLAVSWGLLLAAIRDFKRSPS